MFLIYLIQVVHEGACYEFNRFVPAIRGAPVSAIACNFDGIPREEITETTPLWRSR